MTSTKNSKLVRRQADLSGAPELGSPQMAVAETRRRFLTLFAAGAAGVVLGTKANAVWAATQSADNTAIPPASQIIDAAGNTWTLGADQFVYINGTHTGANGSRNAVMVLWYGSKIYHQNTSNEFYVWQGGNWSRSADPRSAVSSSKPHFYGICGHYDYGSSKAQLVSDLQSIGATMFRVDTGGFNPTNVQMAGRFTQMTAIDPSIKIFCCITTDFLGTDENSAYNIAFTNGQTLAQTLGPMGITDFECGNELTADTRVFRKPGAPGNLMGDYIAGNDWNRMRGTMRGLIDGIKSVNPAFRCGINFTIAQIAASDMLWNGVSPDGSTGHPTVRWDITTWHNYQVYGDLFNISLDGYTTKLNVIDYISKAYGKPIMITEWQGTQSTDAQKAAHCTSFMTEYYNARNQYNIESIMMYQLGGPAEFGLFANPQEKAAFAAFTSSHPA